MTNRKLTPDEAKKLNGMNPDRIMPATQKQGMIKSVKETINTLRGK